jgi:hypothetical protein
MEPSSESALFTQESERQRLKGPHIIHHRSTDTFLFINSEEKRKKKSRVSLPRLPSCKPRANSTDLYSLPSKVNQFMRTERLKESKSSRVLTRDVSHLQDIIAKLPTERDRNYKEVIVGMQDSNYFLSTDIRYLQKLLHNSDELGIPVTTNHFGMTERLNCKKESCIDKAFQQTNKFKSQTPSPVRSPRIDGEKFIDKILKPETTPDKKPRLKFVSLGNPTGRQDVENLKKWLAYMQEEYLAGIDDSINDRVDEEKQEMVYTIYFTTLKELIRQVSVHCVERGGLLQDTIEKLTRHWSLTSKASIKLLKKQRYKHESEMNELKNLHARQFVKYQSKLDRVRNS